jgi:nickel-dependent lactate racemase
MKKAVVPILAWYGDETLELDFPDNWDVTVCNMTGANAPVLSDKEIRAAFDNPIGSKTIKELAKGKKEVAILFDDLTRPTPSILLVPYILEQLADVGIQDENIRFISALGAHGSMDNIAFRKKLGDEVTGRFRVYNHNPYENCTPLGKSTRGTPIAANSEMMTCDLKIGIGSIIPHPYGFGGGSKIIIPGVVSIDTIDANHGRLNSSKTVGMGKYEGNIVREDMDEAARMVGLDVKIDAVLNLKREMVALFVGDVVEEYAEGVKFARKHYATEMVQDADIVIANCYSKANEMALAPRVAYPLLAASGGDMVILAITPEGQITHYLGRSFGRDFGGRLWVKKTGLPERTKRLTVMTPYPDRSGADWLAPYEQITWLRSWQEVITQLKSSYGDKAKVAVIPDATLQYFPEALK